MKQRSIVSIAVLSAIFAAGLVASVTVLGESRCDHVAWVREELSRMQTIKPGMTRAELLEVFTTEGGLFTGLERTFVSRSCPYFKVHVELRAVGRPARNADGRVTLVEDGRDVIVSISRPYLELSVTD